MMKLEKLSCNSCGAPLEVPTTANFVTCNHCSVQLTIHRGENVTFTEQLQELAGKTKELSERLDDMADNSEVAALDREWEFEQRKYMVSGKNGSKSIPTESSAIGGGVVITLFGCFWTAMAFGITSSAPSFGPFVIAKVAFPLFGLVFIGAGIASSVSAHTKAGKYRRAEERYKRRRAELLGR